MFTALPAIAVLAVLGALLAISHRDASAGDRRRESAELAASAALNARGYLDDRFDVMAAVGVAPEFRSRAPRLRAFLVDAARAGGFDTLGFVDMRGRTVVSSGLPAGAPPIDVADRPYIQAGLAGRPAVSDVLDSRVTNRPALAFASPVRAGDGRVTALVGGALQLDVVGNALRRLLTVADAGNTTIVDAAGNVIVGPRPIRGLEPAPAAYPLARMRASRGGTLRAGDRVLGFRAVAGTGWIVVVDRGYGAVIGPLDRALWFEIGALAVFALVGVLLTLAAARRLDRLDRVREVALSEQREIALTLQRSQLPDLAVPDGLAASAHYVPAQGVVAVGGDWYDLVDTGDGRVVINVGDVAGHGLQAAATMGKLRSAARMEALSGTAPAGALQALYRFAASLAPPPLATVAYAVLDLETGRLRYALAGHPPPLLIRADGATTFLEGARSPLLGVPPVDPRPEGEVTLRAGDTLVVYTDGLVEDPESTIDAGLATLAERAVGLAGDVTTMAERLLARVPEPRRDDAAVLAVRFLGARQPSSVAS